MRKLLIILGMLIIPLIALADTETVQGLSQPGALQGSAWFTGTQAVGAVQGVTAASQEEESPSSCESCTTDNDSALHDSGVTVSNDFAYTYWFAYQVTVSATRCITGIQATVCDQSGSTGGTFELYTDSSGSPGSRVGDGYTVTISDYSDALADNFGAFASTQTLEAGTYWIVIKQAGGSHIGYGTSGTGTMKYSDDSGSTWTDATGSYYWDVSLWGCTP